jgi:hypothetical protein
MGEILSIIDKRLKSKGFSSLWKDGIWQGQVRSHRVEPVARQDGSSGLHYRLPPFDRSDS